MYEDSRGESAAELLALFISKKSSRLVEQQQSQLRRLFQFLDGIHGRIEIGGRDDRPMIGQQNGSRRTGGPLISDGRTASSLGTQRVLRAITMASASGCSRRSAPSHCTVRMPDPTRLFAKSVAPVKSSAIQPSSGFMRSASRSQSPARDAGWN